MLEHRDSISQDCALHQLVQGLAPTDSVRYWADAFAEEPVRLAGGVIIKLMKEYALLREQMDALQQQADATRLGSLVAHERQDLAAMIEATNDLRDPLCEPDGADPSTAGMSANAPDVLHAESVQSLWPTIDTAPTDGTLVLLGCEGWEPSALRGEAWPVKVGGHWQGKWNVFGASWAPTHWAPLPRLHFLPLAAQEVEQRCIDACNVLNVALYGDGAVIDSLEEAVQEVCARLAKQLPITEREAELIGQGFELLMAHSREQASRGNCSAAAVAEASASAVLRLAPARLADSRRAIAQ